MTLVNPDVFDRSIVSANGVLTSASQIQASDSQSVEQRLARVDTNITRLLNAAIGWRYETETVQDPGLNSFRFNNSDPTLATIIYVDVFSISGRFDEYLLQYPTGGFIYLQDTTNRVNNFLFRTTGAITQAGGTDGWFVIPVENLRSQSTITAVATDRFTFIFLPPASSGTGGGGELPNMFLNEISVIQRPVFTRKIDTEATVRIWVRSALVTPATVATPGVGLVIAEANGDLPEDGDTFQDDQDLLNHYLYFTIDDSFDSATDLNTVWVVRKNSAGELRDAVNVGSDFILQTDIDGAAAGKPYRSNTGYNGNGGRINYTTGDTIELFFGDTVDLFVVSQTNAPNVDLTESIKSLNENQLSESLSAIVNFQHGSPFIDQFKLDQLVAVSSTSTSATLTGVENVYFKKGAFSRQSIDYFTTTFDTGLPPNLGTENVVWTVVVPNVVAVSSASGEESGTAVATLVKRDVLFDDISGTFSVYEITLPPTASETNDFLLVGTSTTVTLINPTSLFQINRTNVEPDFLTHIENPSGTDTDSARITALENKITVLYPLSPDVDALTNWADIYEPERPVQQVVLSQGYDLVADYRGDATRYESAGVTYDATGTNVVRYTGLSESLERILGFKVNGPANQVLMWLINGAEIIPFIDMTAAGNFRINNYTQATVASQPTQETTRLLLVTGDTNIISVASLSNARFIIPDYPAGATDTSRSVSVGFDVLVNGSDTQGEHFENFDIPETQVAQDRIQRSFDIYLGPLHGNRTVSVTIDYRFVVAPGPEYRIIFTLVNAPSDVTIRVQDVFMTRSYTPAATVTRTDDFEILQDAAGNYVFTGEAELLLSFHPSTVNNTMLAVPAVIDSAGTVDELNDRRVPVPAHDFTSVEIPDTVALTGFEFRTARLDHYLNHDDLATLLADRAVQWFYGHARLRTIATAHAVSEPIDLAAGSTIGGSPFAAGRVWQDSQSFTAAASVTVTLPTPSTLSSFSFIEITWHTGVGTATDNNNRNYSELGSMAAIINASDAELILGGRGRGAENYGIEVDTTGLTGTETTLTMSIINLNDTAGAALPAGSLITAVRFY